MFDEGVVVFRVLDCRALRDACMMVVLSQRRRHGQKMY